MRHVWKCRRTFISVLSIGALLALGLVNSTDVSGAIATIAIGLAAANAGEAAMTKKKGGSDDGPT